MGLQFILYSIVGAISSIIDFGTFWLLVTLKAPLMVSSTVSFVLATLLNYFLSYKVAFVRGKYSPASEILRFWVVSLIGLGLNTSLIWFFVSVAGRSPLIGKVAALPIVFGWNYLGRRLLVFHSELPPLAMALMGQKNSVSDSSANPNESTPE